MTHRRVMEEIEIIWCIRIPEKRKSCLSVLLIRRYQKKHHIKNHYYGKVGTKRGD